GIALAGLSGVAVYRATVFEWNQAESRTVLRRKDLHRSFYVAIAVDLHDFDGRRNTRLGARHKVIRLLARLDQVDGAECALGEERPRPYDLAIVPQTYNEMMAPKLS